MNPVEDAGAVGEASRLAVQRVTTLTDPRVAVYRLMRDGDLRHLNQMILDSEKIVLRALKAGQRVLSILASQEYYERHVGMLREHPEVELFVGSRSLLQEIVGHRIHQGMMAIAARPVDGELSDLGPRIVALDGLADAANVGAIVRGCHAFGVSGILIGEGCPSPYVRRAIRVSMGSALKMRIRHSKGLIADLEALKHSGYRTFGAGIWEGAQPVGDVRFPPETVLVIGNEDQGLRPEVRARCDTAVKVPLASGIDSLNAACAASVILYAMSTGSATGLPDEPLTH